MLTPFELMVIFRIQVTDRALRRQYLAVEATMETLAPALGLAVDVARMTGLGIGMDAQLCRGNERRRGELAAELLETDRAAPEVVNAVVACRRDPVETLTPLAAAAFASETLVLTAWALVEDESLDDLDSFDLVSRLNRRSRVRGDPAATRCLACADRLSSPLETLAGATLDAMRRIRSDLAL